MSLVQYAEGPTVVLTEDLLGAGEKAPWLRTLAAVPECPGPVLSSS